MVAGSVEGPDRGGGGLAAQRFGVGEVRIAIHGAVQVGVADPPRGDVAASVDPPTTTIGDTTDLLHVEVDHVAGEPGNDPAGAVVRGTGGAQATQPGYPGVLQPS